jgi:hypothetical protein
LGKDIFAAAMEDSQAGTSASINQMETNRWSYPECGMVGYKDPSHYPSYARAAYTSHVCSTFCKFEEEKQSGLDEYVRVVHSPLMLPLLFGWFREIKSRSYGRNPAIQDRVHYVAPCGKVLGNIEKLQDYLVCVDSILPVTLFTFELDVHLYRKFSIKKACVSVSILFSKDSDSILIEIEVIIDFMSSFKSRNAYTLRPKSLN